MNYKRLQRQARKLSEARRMIDSTINEIPSDASDHVITALGELARAEDLLCRELGKGPTARERREQL